MKHLETFLKLVIIGILTALVRAYGQSFIPVVEEPLLWPSIFADGGITTLAFIVFGSVFYTAIAALFLMMDKNLRGGRFVKGLKFSFFLALIWVAYLLEPLPHVTLAEKFAYPLVDGVVILFLGILSGFLLGTSNKKNNISKKTPITEEAEDKLKGSELGTILDNILSLEEVEGEEETCIDQEGILAKAIDGGEKTPIEVGTEEETKDRIDESEPLVSDTAEHISEIKEVEALEKGNGSNQKKGKGKFSVLNVIIIGLFFFLGRIAMYKHLSIYSFFGTQAIETLLWALCTGLVIGVVYELTAPYICSKRWYLRFLVFGGIYLAVVLFAFNGLKPLVYRMDSLDLLIRSVGDCVAVVLASGICLLFDFKKNLILWGNNEK